MFTFAEATVHVIDNNCAVLETLKQVYRMTSAVFNIQYYSSGEEFLDHYSDDGATCLLTEMKLRGMSGLELQKEARQRGIKIPIIFVGESVDTSNVAQCFRNGAFDYLEKPLQPQQLAECLEAAVQQDKERRKHRQALQKLTQRFSRLTERERQVVEMIYNGYPNKGIAHELGIKMGTVEYHRSNIMRKLEVDSVPELVRMTMVYKDDVKNPDICF
jgi:RNA polymerase sigma factor (sigma-70 family)